MGSPAHKEKQRWSGRGQETREGAVRHSRSEVWRGSNSSVCQDRAERSLQPGRCVPSASSAAAGGCQARRSSTLYCPLVARSGNQSSLFSGLLGTMCESCGGTEKGESFPRGTMLPLSVAVLYSGASPAVWAVTGKVLGTRWAKA